MTSNNCYYISPEDSEKDEDGDIIMTDVNSENNNIDGETTSVSTRNEDDDYYYDDDEDDDDDYNY